MSEEEKQLFEWKRKRQHDPGKCAVKGCRRDADGFTPTTVSNHLRYMPVCEKCHVDATTHKPTPFADVVRQRDGVEDLAKVLNLSEETVGFMIQDLTPPGVAPEVVSIEEGSFDISVVAAIPAETVKRLEKELADATAMLAQMDTFHIANQEQMDNTDALMKDVKRVWKELEDQRKSIGKPLRDQQKRVQDYFKPVLNALDRVEVLLKGKIQEAHDRARQAQQAALEAAQAAHQVGNTAQVAIATQQAAAGGLDLAPGTSQRTTTKYQLVDITQVPPQYLMTVLNEALIQAAIDQGVTQIPGIRIYEEQTLAART
jgi:hypothetical protein